MRKSARSWPVCRRRARQAGACATEMTSAVFTGGYLVLQRAIDELDRYLAARGRTVSELLGLAADHVQSYQEQISRQDYWQAFAPATD